MNRFERMQTFTLVAESHSFAEVARKMGVTTAAVSKQMLMLETHLGLQLLNRSTRSHSVSLTEAGKIYYENCKRIISDVLECEDIISGMKSEPAGVLNIFASSDFAAKFIIPNMNEYMTRYPKVKFKIEMLDRYPDFRREDVDIFAGVSLISPPDLASVNLCESRHITVASPAYLQKQGEPKMPKDLCDHTLINHFSREDVFYFKRDQSIQLTPSVQFNSIQGMLNAAIEDLGVTQIVDFYVEDAIKYGKLKEVLTSYREPTQRQRVFYRKSRFTQPKIQSFVEFIQEKAK